jgi:hypothetical protein
MLAEKLRLPRQTWVDEHHRTHETCFGISQVETIEDVGEIILFDEQVTKRHLMNHLTAQRNATRLKSK